MHFKVRSDGHHTATSDGLRSTISASSPISYLLLELVAVEEEYTILNQARYIYIYTPRTPVTLNRSDTFVER